MQQPIDANSLRTLLDEAGFSAFADALVPLLKPAIAITSRRVENEQDIPIGASKLGGSPDLPPEISWPEYRGRKLIFVAQINLIDAKPLDPEGLLPNDGILYFFYDGLWWTEEPEDYEPAYGRVLYYTGFPDSLQRTERGTDRSDSEAFPVRPYASCSLAFSRHNTLPHLFELVIELPEEMRDKYWDFSREISAINDQQDGFHRMFGYPDVVQNPIIVEADVSLQRIQTGKWDYDKAYQHEHEWVLLLQIDSDENADMMWDDSGTLYYCIKRDALQKADFEQVVAICQSL